MEILLSRNGDTVLRKRYLRKDENRKIIETPKQLFERSAIFIAGVDSKYNGDVKKTKEEFYDVMSAFDFLPNSPTLSNAGLPNAQLNACFVLPIEDSMDSIFETLKNTAKIHKSGGGTGFSFSNIRPHNDIIMSSKGESSGPVSFMTVYNAATEAVKQGGTRRGANMGMLRVDHPDILEFIDCKKVEGALANFNISVAITDEFMKALKEDGEYVLINPRTKLASGKLKAKVVYDKLVENAWINGEPGVIFIDTINKYNPIPTTGAIEATNPCGEQPLESYGSCNLGSVNLGKFVKEGKIDWDRLAKVVKIAVHFLDNVIDANWFPIKKIEEVTKRSRKIGLGVMGWADMLYQLALPYNTMEAVKTAEDVMKFIREKGIEESERLAQERGAFDLFSESIYSQGKPRRNATITTIAPTGTIGIIADASGGIEPAFGLSYKRENVLDGNEALVEYNKYFEEEAKKQGIWTDELKQALAKDGNVKDNPSVPENMQKVFVTALGIDAKWHLRMQVAFQKYTDNAVSKTINLPNSCSKEDIAEIFVEAYDSGCKGVTIYRDGSRNKQVLNIGKKKEAYKKIVPRERERITKGDTRLMKTGCGKMYVTVNEDSIGFCEIFAEVGKNEGCVPALVQGTSRVISLALRSGVDEAEIVSQLCGIRCGNACLVEGGSILSCPDALGQGLKERLKEKLEPGLFDKMEKAIHENDKLVLPCCPDCGEPLEYSEGCNVCRACGFSKCS